jgi:uncharacterized protein (DUF1800 family)
MSVSRRRFLEGSAAVAATVAAGTGVTIANTAAQAEEPLASAAAAPSPAAIALHRMAYGPRPGEIDAVTQQGLQAYVDQQLSPAAIADADCDRRLREARLRIRYGADSNGQYPAADKMIGLDTINSTASDDELTAQLWPLTNFQASMDWQERMRPFNEVRIATWIRATYSKRQLLEVVVDFWHNHFNVNAGGEVQIAATLPVYDRIIRRHALGNFRQFLEATTRSTAMMYYLDNASNRAGGGEGGNENYARELFELHTLGSDNYRKFTEDIGSIPTGPDGVALFYVDDDVYEAARCFTGWTIKNGHWERRDLNDGTFYYDDEWHDSNQKIVLGRRIARSGGEQDGRIVLDLLANHPGTARHVCTKLCRRLIADSPPSNVIDAAVATWMANRSQPDQIKRVLRTILLSPEFQSAWGFKTKRPFEAIVAFLRATNAELTSDYVDPSDNNKGFVWNSRSYQLDAVGHRLFEWPTPTGYPDLASHWVSTNGLLRRWNMPFVLSQWWGGNVQIDLVGQTNLNATATQIVDFWIARLCGFAIDPGVRNELIAFMAQGGRPDQPPKPLAKAPDWNDANAVKDRLVAMVQLIAMCPDFHAR